MTWSTVKLAFMLYLMIGLVLAELGLELSQRQGHPVHAGPYLRTVFLGPLRLLIIVIGMLVAAIDERLMWHQHLGHGLGSRFWAIAIVVLVLLSTLIS